MTQSRWSFRPLAGCGLFLIVYRLPRRSQVSVPLRGVGCFSRATASLTHTNGFRPLAGCGLFHELDEQRGADRGFRPLAGCGLFPLPGRKHQKGAAKFPSPCGVWVVSKKGANSGVNTGSFRPLAGRGLFPSGRCLRHGLSGVSVPLRGVGCFIRVQAAPRAIRGFRPLAGCGLFHG